LITGTMIHSYFTF